MARTGLDKLRISALDNNDNALEILDVKGITEVNFEVTNENTTVYADNGIYEVLDGGISEVSTEINLVDLTTEIKETLFGLQTENGMQEYKKDFKAPYTAMSFRQEFQNGHLYIGLLKGKPSLPSLSSSTKEGAPEAQTDAVTTQWMERGDQGVIYVIGDSNLEDFSEAKFYERVFGTASEA